MVDSQVSTLLEPSPLAEKPFSDRTEQKVTVPIHTTITLPSAVFTREYLFDSKVYCACPHFFQTNKWVRS
jgi:hypothetical protein